MSNEYEKPFPIFKKIALTIQQLLAVLEADVRRLWHDPYELLMRMFQPAIWLLIFGQAMSKVITTKGSYLDYIAPGILAQSILFIGIFYGIALIWEKDLGILHRILVTPAPRAILVLGRALAVGIRGFPQVLVIYLLSFLLRIHLRFDSFSWLGVLAMVFLSAAIFSTFSLIIAAIVKRRERFMGIGQILSMPLFFASNALYPMELMPAWLRFFSHFNPLTYQVDALRSLMIVGELSQFGLLMDFGVNIFVFILLLAIATFVYPKMLH